MKRFIGLVLALVLTLGCAGISHAEGQKAPEICPVCAHPQSYFEIREENY